MEKNHRLRSGESMDEVQCGGFSFGSFYFSLVSRRPFSSNWCVAKGKQVLATANAKGPRLTDVSRSLWSRYRSCWRVMAFGQTAGAPSDRATAVNCGEPDRHSSRRLHLRNTATQRCRINPQRGALCGGTINRDSGNGVPDFSICSQINTGTKRQSHTQMAAAPAATSSTVSFISPGLARTQGLHQRNPCDRQPSSQLWSAGAAAPSLVRYIRQHSACLRITAQLAISFSMGRGKQHTCAAGIVFTPRPTLVAASGRHSPGVVTFRPTACNRKTNRVRSTSQRRQRQQTGGGKKGLPQAPSLPAPASIAINGPRQQRRQSDGQHWHFNTRPLGICDRPTNRESHYGLQLTYTSTLRWRWRFLFQLTVWPASRLRLSPLPLQSLLLGCPRVESVANVRSAS